MGRVARVGTEDVERLILANARLAAQIRRNRAAHEEMLAVAQAVIEDLEKELEELEMENLELNIRLGLVESPE